MAEKLSNNLCTLGYITTCEMRLKAAQERKLLKRYERENQRCSKQHANLT
jgi:hypothetical protein